MARASTAAPSGGRSRLSTASASAVREREISQRGLSGRNTAPMPSATPGTAATPNIQRQTTCDSPHT